MRIGGRRGDGMGAIVVNYAGRSVIIEYGRPDLVVAT